MIDTVDCVVVGAGVVGLAIARRVALAEHEVFVLEAEDRIGSHASSRNSEVIHAGIYYPPGSLKAELCVLGKAALYRYCHRKRVPCARLGKLIVATTEGEVETLRGILDNGLENGVRDLEWLGPRQIAVLEPAVEAQAAILSPSTGIVDSHALMFSLQGDLEARGGMVLLNHRVSRVVADGDGFLLFCRGEESAVARCRRLVNAAGLWASSFARCIEGLDEDTVPETSFAIGRYYGYAQASPFRRLVYPVPIVGGLGIHATIDLAGQVRFGPDAEWIEQLDYRFDEESKSAFVSAIGRYYPGLDASKLSPSYTGVRPKLYRPGAPPVDFVIQGPADHGVAGLVNLFGIESPGLTSSLAIADRVHTLLR